MPCYRCGTRQVDPEAGKSSPWRRGVVREHQVLVCPACVPAAAADLERCTRCGSAHLIRRLDQVECLDCRLIRDAEPESPAPRPAGPPPPAGSAGPAASASAVPATSAPGTHAFGARGAPNGDLAAEVARALDKVLGRR